MIGFLNEKTVILSDLDGTLAEILLDSAACRVDAVAYNALKKFNSKFPNQVIPITGRDWEQVIQVFHGERPPFPVISSNGAQLHLPNGKEYTHHFSDDENGFINEMRSKMTEFKLAHPELVAEVKRFEIGFHDNPAIGYENIDRRIITKLSEKCLGMMERLERQAQSNGLSFSIGKTCVTHWEISYRQVDKLSAMNVFSDYLPTLPKENDCRNVLYMGDCFLSGNDRKIATWVKKNNGMLIQVTNGVSDRIPGEGDPAEPHYAVATQTELGGWINNLVDRVITTPVRPTRKPAKNHNFSQLIPILIGDCAYT